MIMNIKGSIATILLHEEVTSQTATAMLDFIYGVEFLDEVEDIIVSINSGGGSVVAGFSIYSALRNSPKTVTTRIEGIGASIAGVIFMAGDKKEMNDYSLFMMHSPSGGDQEVLDKIQESLKLILGVDFKGDLEKMLNDETWLSAKEMDELLDLTIIDSKEDIRLEPQNEVSELYDICNNILKNNISEMKENEENENVTEEVIVNETEVETVVETETENEETVEEVETETETEEVEVVNETEVETEEVETEEVIETENEIVNETEIEISVENNTILDELTKLKEENESLRKELEILNNKKLEETKLEILNASNIESDKYEEWMNMEVDTIKKLVDTIKVTASAPQITINTISDTKLDHMNQEEKLAFANANPKLYVELLMKK